MRLFFKSLAIALSILFTVHCSLFTAHGQSTTQISRKCSGATPSPPRSLVDMEKDGDIAMTACNGRNVNITASGSVNINGTPVILSSPLTTKGDIWGFSTINARVGVGTNGKVLTADSTAATGVSWQTPTTGTVTGTGTINTLPKFTAAGDLITVKLSVAGAAAVSTSIASIVFEVD